MRSTTGPGRRRGWAAAACGLLLAAGAAAADKALTTVVQVDHLGGKTEVVLAAGRRDGMGPAAQVQLLREGQPIVHPVTGKVLGTPQEPVAVARVYEVLDRQSRALVVKTFSLPQVDDLGEYDRIAVAPAAPAPEPVVAAPPREDARLGLVIERLDDLEAKVEQYRKAARPAKVESAPIKPVWDELATMRGQLTGLDRRLAALEAQASENRTRLDALASGEYRAADVREFTVRYTADTQVKLKVAGKTLVVSVERDSMHLEQEAPPVPSAEAPAEAPTGREATREHPAAEGAAPASVEPAPAPIEPVAPESGAVTPHEPPPEPLPSAEAGTAADTSGQPAQVWYQTPWAMGAGILIVGLLAGVVWYVIKRRYDDVMEGLEEFEEEEDGEEEEEDDEEEETTVRRRRK